MRKSKTSFLSIFIFVAIAGVIMYFWGKHAPRPDSLQNNTPNAQGATRDDNMAMGNPSVAGSTDKNNYLVRHAQYSLSYNNNLGHANWVSWHLSTAWKGNAPRSNHFRPDSTLPSGFYRVTTKDYNSSGFDRGHLCPSDDRDANSIDNGATFLMDNMIPQAPKCNQNTWRELEEYCRDLAYKGNEMYIVAGAYGRGGVNKSGTLKQAIGPGGRVIVPSNVWKVVLILPNGTNDIGRVTAETQVIAVDMPNTQTVAMHNWQYYITTVDAIEAKTGFNLFSVLPDAIQNQIEGKAYPGGRER